MSGKLCTISQENNIPSVWLLWYAGAFTVALVVTLYHNWLTGVIVLAVIVLITDLGFDDDVVVVVAALTSTVTVTTNAATLALTSSVPLSTFGVGLVSSSSSGSVVVVVDGGIGSG